MSRSAETIGALAAALAKAQAELTNPEKSLTASLPGGSPGAPERSFRYAPLASGLEIVRKCLGRHEIAVVQTATVDDRAGLVRLTTMLAHASGVWLSSDWPVCAIAETASPHRMGAALTYARRYALFAMVGIAGEDDMDAPDLTTPSEATAHVASPASANGKGNGHAGGPPIPPRGRPPASPSPAPLTPEQSAQTRASVLAELDALGAAEDLTEWAKRTLPVKSAMTPEDGHSIDAAFRSKMAAIEEEMTGDERNCDEPQSVGADGDRPHTPSSKSAPAKKGARRARAARSDAGSLPITEPGAPVSHGAPALRAPIDKSVLALSEPRRYRNRAHLEFVASQPCLVCERRPSDPHHLRFAQPSALGRRVSDEFTVPLCRSHHRALHRRGDETEWWQNNGIDPVEIAQKLWQMTRSGKTRFTSDRRSPDVHMALDR